MRATLAGAGTPGSPANLNTFVCNSISRRFAAATHVVHFADPSLFRSCFFCLPSLSLVFLTPIYANLLGIVLDASRWGVGMPSGGKLSCSRTLRSAACLIDCAIEARGRRGERGARRGEARVHFAAKSRASWATFLICFSFCPNLIAVSFFWLGKNNYAGVNVFYSPPALSLRGLQRISL